MQMASSVICIAVPECTCAPDDVVSEKISISFISRCFPLITPCVREFNLETFLKEIVELLRD